MGRQERVIDYLDLSLSVPPAFCPMVEERLKHFVDNHDYVEITPRLKGGVLRINSTDLISFLGYVDPSKMSEMEIHRLKLEARQALERQLLKSLSLSAQAHYKWCLTALKSLEIGRFLKDGE